MFHYVKIKLVCHEQQNEIIAFGLDSFSILYIRIKKTDNFYLIKLLQSKIDKKEKHEILGV